MTERDSTEVDPRLDDLDRRATSAVSAVDRVVADAPVPGFGAPATARRHARGLVAAAVLAVVALIGAGVVLLGGDGDEETTIAGEPNTGGLTHLVLPEPNAGGFELAVAFEGDPTASTASAADSPLTIQGPEHAADPWAEAVVEYSLPAGTTTLDGEPVDIGVDGAVYDGGGIAPSVGWPDDDRVRYLMSVRMSREALESVAAAEIADGHSTDAIPTQRVLYRGILADVFPSQAPGGQPPSSHDVVVYEEAGSLDGSLAVAVTAGSESRWRAASALAASTETRTVRGREATVARYRDVRELMEVSWLEGDGTLVRAIVSGTEDVDAVTALLDTLIEIDDTEFAELAAQHSLDDSKVGDGDAPVDDRDATEQPSSGLDAQQLLTERPLASAVAEERGLTIEASVRQRDDGSALLWLDVSGPDSSTGSGTDLPSLDENGVVRLDLEDGRVALAGLIGPSDGNVAIEHADDGVAVDLGDPAFIGPIATPIEGSEAVVFLAIVPGSLSLDGVVAATLGPDGERVSVPLT